MKIIYKYGDGLVIQDVEQPQEKFLQWSQDFEDKINLFIRPNINEEFTDIVETATEEEISLYKQQQIEILNKNQYDELQPYDWYFTRFIRKGIEVPKEIVDITNEIDERYKKLKEKYK